MISTIFYVIVMGGPVIYIMEGNTNHERNDLQFFDCFGPLMTYGLGTITVIVWCCHERVLISPKEHLLLYNKLVVHRPTGNYKLIGAKETDWAALRNLSHSTLSEIFLCL